MALSAAREGHIASHVAFRIVDGFHAGDGEFIVAGADLQQLGQLRNVLRIRDALQKTRLHKERRHAVAVRDHGDIAGVRNPRLIAEPLPRRYENEGQNHRYHDVVPDTSARKIPKDELLDHLYLSYQDVREN